MELSRNQKITLLLILVIIAIALLSWFLRRWGIIGAGVGGFVIGYIAGRKNK